MVFSRQGQGLNTDERTGTCTVSHTIRGRNRTNFGGRELHLGRDQRDEGFPERVYSQIEVLKGRGADQDQVSGVPTEHNSRGDLLRNEDFGQGHWLGDDGAISVLDPACAKRSNTELLQERPRDLREMGSCAYEAFQVERALRVGRLSYREFHVEGSHASPILPSV